ncbi:MAG TPA: hypothetical protein VGQ72_14775 [Pyrinomonadaceae bacterium]|nr:hypothetical protein [Pyrinomonadaceae bacterium]
MVVSLILSLIAVASGFVLTYAFEEDEPLAARLCSGACIGFAAMGVVGFLFALAFGLYAITLTVTAAITAAPLLLLISQSYRSRIDEDINKVLRAISRATTRPNRWNFIYFLFYAAVVVAMWLIFSRALLEKPEGIYTGVLNNYGDLPFHLSVITRFAYGQNFPPEDPTFAGVRFTYPFVTDFISAMFVRAGASLRNSMFIENYIIGVALVGVVHRFGQRLVANRTAAILTPLLILLNGGFGWTMIWGDVSKVQGGVFQVLRQLAHSYTILPEIEKGWRWGNSITSLLVTQRGFLLGIPLAVIVIGLWWEWLQSGKSDEQSAKANEPKSPKSGRPTEASSLPFALSSLPLRRMLAAGIIAGLLPLIHAHSFITLMMVAVFLVPWVYRRAWLAYGIAILIALLLFLIAARYEAVSSIWMKVAFAAIAFGVIANLYFLLPWSHLRLWLCYFIAALVIGAPQILWSTHHSAVKTQSFVSWKFGWDSDQEPPRPRQLDHQSIGEYLASLGPHVEPVPVTNMPPMRAWLKRAPYVMWFWLKNTGLFIPLLIIALVWKPDDYLIKRKLLLFYLPFTLCFFVPNFVKLAPWVWDNIKMLFYWWIVSAPIVALLLARLWEQHVGQKVLAASLLVLLTLAGALDIFPLLIGQGEYQEFDRDGVVFAESIKQSTPPTATILHAPIHNTPIFLTGRKSIMGYPGHIWTHGLDYGPREQEIQEIYSGAPDAAALLAKYRVDYVVISPQEYAVVRPNVAFFEQYPEVANVGDYHLYKISQ